MSVFPVEDFSKYLQKLAVNQTVVGDYIAPVQAHGFSTHTGDFTSCFFYQQNAGGHVPRIQPELPEGFQPTAGSVREVECRRPASADTMRQHGELIVKVDVHILVAFMAGEPGRDQGVAEGVGRTDAHGGPVEPGTGA